MVGLPVVLVLLQPDLGTAMAFVGILFAMLFWAGAPIALLLLVLSPVAALVLAFDITIWSWYIVGLIGFLYLYRYRLFLAEGGWRTSVPEPSRVPSGAPWRSTSGTGSWSSWIPRPTRGARGIS